MTVPPFFLWQPYRNFKYGTVEPNDLYTPHADGRAMAAVEYKTGDEQSGDDEGMTLNTERDEYVHVRYAQGEDVKTLSHTEAVATLRRIHADHERAHTNWCCTPNPGQKPYEYGYEEACAELQIPEEVS